MELKVFKLEGWAGRALPEKIVSGLTGSQWFTKFGEKDQYSQLLATEKLAKETLLKNQATETRWRP